MDIEKKEIHIVPPVHIEQTARFVLVMLGVFLVVLTIGQLKGLAYIGEGVAPTNTISVDGEGDMFAVPDVATFTYSVTENAKDVTAAQTAATKEANAILDYLKSQGVADADVKTTDYSINPHYDYQNSVCAQPLIYGGSSSSDVAVSSAYCPPGRSVITGYDVSQTVSVKVRDMEKAGAILSGVGSKGATNVSGLSLTVSNEDALLIQARGKAIDDAKHKADELAKQLGVSLVRIVGYSEGGNGGPIYYAKAMDMAAGTSASAPTPQIATGQNKLTSNVTIVYEVR